MADKPKKPSKPRAYPGLKPGRGKKKVSSWTTAAKLLAIMCTKDEIAGALGMSAETLDRRCQEDHGVDWAIWARPHQENAKASLRRMQWRNAKKGSDAMLIFLGKVMLGQLDRQEQPNDPGHRTEINISFAELKEAAIAKQQVQQGVDPETGTPA